MQKQIHVHADPENTTATEKRVKRLKVMKSEYGYVPYTVNRNVCMRFRLR